MKTFQQFISEVVQRMSSMKEYGDKSEDPTNFLRNKEKEKIEFKKGTKFKLPLDLVKKKYTGKIDSDVLKAYPELNPDKPGDYTKLKRLTAKLKKA